MNYITPIASPKTPFIQSPIPIQILLKQNQIDAHLSSIPKVTKLTNLPPFVSYDDIILFCNEFDIVLDVGYNPPRYTKDSILLVLL